MESFDTFPLAAVIDNKFLCVHGGLSPELDIVRLSFVIREAYSIAAGSGVFSWDKSGL